MFFYLQNTESLFLVLIKKLFIFGPQQIKIYDYLTQN